MSAREKAIKKIEAMSVDALPKEIQRLAGFADEYRALYELAQRVLIEKRSRARSKEKSA